MALHFVALIFSVSSFVLLLIANLGTTFDSTFLPNIHLVQINQAINNRHIRYGVYNSCLYYPDSKTPHSCTKKLPTYPFGNYRSLNSKKKKSDFMVFLKRCCSVCRCLRCRHNKHDCGQRV